ncbi:MAG: hypothetical protein ACI93R_001644 [Flavobacteriales bacterium]|jgi:hypothetical protein
MTKALIITTLSIISVMAISQIVMALHPDGKEFSASFSSSTEYLQALSEYRSHPITQFRSFWIDNYNGLRVVFVSSLLVFVGTGIKCFISRLKGHV